MRMPTLAPEWFVIFPLGTARFALPTADVVELSRSAEVQRFPHTTPGLAGVLVRRGEILPVWDLAALLGMEKAPKKFWLVTRRNFSGEEPTAIPVSGECQMLRAEMQRATDSAPEHVRGVLMLEDQSVEVLDLARLRTSARASEFRPEAGESERRSSHGRQ